MVLGNLVWTHLNLKSPGRKDSVLNIVNKQLRLLCMRWVMGQGDCQGSVTKHPLCWADPPRESQLGMLWWGHFGGGSCHGTVALSWQRVSYSGMPQLPVQLAEQCPVLLWPLGLLLPWGCLCITGVQVLYLIWDGRSTLALQHLPKHGTELEWLLWTSLSRSKEAVLSWLRQSSTFTDGQIFRGSWVCWFIPRPSLPDPRRELEIVFKCALSASLPDTSP